MPDAHQAMHGPSSLPRELRDVTNAQRGELAPTSGMPVTEIQKRIRYDVGKADAE